MLATWTQTEELKLVQSTVHRWDTSVEWAAVWKLRLCLVREKNLDFDTVPLGAKPAENGDGVFAYCTLESLLSENIDEQ